jgi:hypothetical protein
MDTTDLPLHGRQEGRFFHGYYGSCCYLPLYVFCGDHVLCAYAGIQSRRSARLPDGDPANVAQIRAAWPGVKIILRGDCGFCRDELMTWWEASEVEFVQAGEE